MMTILHRQFSNGLMERIRNPLLYEKCRPYESARHRVIKPHDVEKEKVF